MSVKPISMSKQPPGSALVATPASVVNDLGGVDGTITVRENDEFMINCVVDSSRPPADIKFSIITPAEATTTNSSQQLAPHLLNQPRSLLTSTTNVARNSDQTFKTNMHARLRASVDDHGKTVTCKAENGFSNQKWETKKNLNILCKQLLLCLSYLFFNLILF
jgi:hypothetical protein